MLNNAALVLIRAYRLMVSPLLGGRCRFYPSCSAYAGEAFATHSFLTACTLSLKRVVRCHPLNPGGVDGVPARSATAHERAGKR